MWYFKMQYSVKFVKNFIVKQFKNSTHKMLILSRIEKMVWVVLFCVMWLDFLKSHYKGPKHTIYKVSFSRKSQEILVAHGCRKRKKANMWHGRGNSGGAWPTAFPRSSGCDIRLVFTLSTLQYKKCVHLWAGISPSIL